MPWTVSLLPRADQDLAALAKNEADRKKIEDAIFDTRAGEFIDLFARFLDRKRR
ncbi:MAG: hypothetical protein ABR562_00615 [Thermoplasmatota archaeon]